MTTKWNFMKAKGVYVYPSANASDGGDVNSEVNVSGISKHLIQKNFVIDNRADKSSEVDMPLKVSVKDNKISVRYGAVILDGYYINLQGDTDGYIINNQQIDSTYIGDIPSFIQRCVAVSGDYEKVNHKIVPKSYAKNDPDHPAPYPLIHVVLKLVKDITGNLRGDFLERRSSGVNTLICKGCSWSFLTDEDLATLNTPYIDLAQIYVDWGTTDSLVIYNIVNPPNRSSYINIDSVYDDEGRPLSEILKEEIGKGTGDLTAITHYTPSNTDVPRTKDLQVSVEDGEVKVKRYIQKTPVKYDENGDYVVNLKNTANDYDDTYSIDDIQKRTHVVSSTEIPHTSEDTLAHKIDSKDSGQGTYSLPQINGYTGTTVNNGQSRLLARADHTHDNRYLVKSTNSDPSLVQEVNTKVKFKNDVQVGALTIDSNGDIDNGALKTVVINKPNTQTTTPADCSVQITGSMHATGYISAGKVFNAVWNDYAELRKKDNPREDYEAGTVICKVKGKDTYSPSEYSRNKLVVGVVSDTYGHLLGGDKSLSLEDNLKLYTPIALAGTVLVKVVQGKMIDEGDLLTVSTEVGRATNVAYPEPGTVIGKALESTDGTKDRILMQVMLG